MKTHNNFKSVSKKLNAKKECPGISWKISRNNGNGDGEFDKEIIPLLKTLNNSNWHTVASCAGHSLTYLKNPLKGYGIKSPYRITIFIHVNEKAINKFIKMAENFDNVSNGRFWCELGYRDDYSNLAERGYIPFDIEVNCGTKSVRDRILKKYEEIVKRNS